MYVLFYLEFKQPDVTLLQSFDYCTMDCNSFASLATFKLPSPCRLLTSACCPDKDLVVLLTRLGGRDRISLWKMQGSRKWEVDLTSDDVSATVAGLAWNPSGDG